SDVNRTPTRFLGLDSGIRACESRLVWVPNTIARSRPAHDRSPAVKLAVVGGGSTYTPELVAGLARERERLDLRSVVLHDIDAERREVVGGLARRMLDAAGFAGELTVTDELDR